MYPDYEQGGATMNGFTLYQQNDHCTTYQHIDPDPDYDVLTSFLELTREDIAQGRPRNQWAIKINDTVMMQSKDFTGEIQNAIPSEDFWCSWCFGSGVDEEPQFVNYPETADVAYRESECRNCGGNGYHESALKAVQR